MYLNFVDDSTDVVWCGEGLLVVDCEVDEVELSVEDGDGPGGAAGGDVEHPEGPGQLAVQVGDHGELYPLQPEQYIYFIIYN